MDRRGPESGTAGTETAIEPRSWVERRFATCLAAIGVGALALRVVYVVHQRWNLPLVGDAWFYHWQADLLSRGHGFISSSSFYMAGITRESADHPPLFTLYLTALDLVGLRSPRGQLLTLSLMGTATVVILGLVGRRIGGARAGLITAAIAATYPPLWVNEGTLVSESMFLLVVSAVLYTIYRYWESQSTRLALVIAGLIGVATLVRAEALLILPFVLLPMVVRATKHKVLVQRFGVVFGLAMVTATVISPWVLFNLARFDRPMLLSADGITLAEGNCDSTYHGVALGYYDLNCIHGPSVAGPQLERYYAKHDQSVENAQQRSQAFRYMRAHIDEVPGVMLARVGRLWQITRVDQTRRFDIEIEGRDHYAVTIGYWYTYALMPLAAAGAVVVFRRRVPITPLVMLIFIATVTSAMALGVLRYRVLAEPALVLLAAMAVASALHWVTNRPRPAEALPSG